MLRNIGTIPPHNQGWGRGPDNSDSSLSANIDRIRVQRNKGFGHLTTTCMSDNEFQEGWKVIERCVKEIQKIKTTKTDYMAEMNRLKEEATDGETEHRYIEKYRDLHKIAEETNDGVKDIKDSVCKLERTIVFKTNKLHQAIGDETDTLKQAFLDQNEALQEVIANRNKEHTQSKRKTKLQKMIDSTRSMVDKQSQKEYTKTQAFQNAKDKLCTNGVVVIKGNTGDGKTRLAIQLLAWIIDRGNNQAKDPIELRDLSCWEDTVDPESNLAVYIDDLFHDYTSRSTSMNVFENRKKYFGSTFSGDKNIGGNNFLIVVVRNDDFNSLNLESDVFFQTANVVDLSKTDSISREDKLNLLRIYKPVTENFKEFNDEEKEEILKCAPLLGFAQCCVLYRNVSVLHPERVDFFRRPFQFLKTALSKLGAGRCAALLYLFLCGGEFKTGLDVSSDEIDKEKIQAAFQFKLLKTVKIPDLSSDVDSRIELVMESLDCLCGSLVVKYTEYKLKDGCYIEYFKFSHDSIRDTVALLYGEKTKLSFIQNCHCNSLCYITTSKNTPNKIFIDPGNYKHMYSRLLRDLNKCKHPINYKYIASLDVWNDSQFMSGFFRWLDGKGIDKDFYLKWTTEDLFKFGPYHFYTDRGDRYDSTSESDNSHSSDRGDRYNSESDDSDSSGRGESDDSDSSDGGERFYSESDDSDSSDGGDRYRGHKYFPSFLVYVAHSNNLCLLNQLLERTPNDHPQLQCGLFSAVRAGHVDVFNMIIERGIIQTTVRAHMSRLFQSRSFGQMRYINVLHEACLFERVEMVTKLATKYPSLVQDTYGYEVGCKMPTLHVVVKTGNCSLYDTIETIILGDISREDRIKRLSETVDWRRRTVLGYSCSDGYHSNTMVLHLLHKYPELASFRDKYGLHCLHYIAYNSNKDLFIQVNSYLQKYYKDKGINYDITTIVNNDGESVLDRAKEGWRNEDLCSYLSQFWS